MLVELVREGRFIKSSFKIKGVSVFFFFLKCGTALKNIELDIHFLDNHSGFEFRLF